jgi:putative FmdB family regulatory protein
MPIYEYEATAPRKACLKCRRGFEALQAVGDHPLSTCPECGTEVKRIISWCRSAVTERPDEGVRVERRIREYEKSGMWSHAAELADKHSERTKDKGLKLRAVESYAKAGYDSKPLDEHLNSKDD